MATQNRNQASAAARRNAQLNQLDSLGSNRSDFDSGDMFNSLDNVVADFIQRVKSNIQAESDMVVTGAIEDIKTEVSSNGILIKIPAHLAYQDLGVNGSIVKNYNTPFSYKDKKPPAAVFADWIKTKNIQLDREEFFGGNPSPFEELDNDKIVNQAAYAMREKVFKGGFKPRNVYSKEIPALVQDVQQQVANYLAGFIQQQAIAGNGTHTSSI